MGEIRGRNKEASVKDNVNVCVGKAFDLHCFL